MRSFLLTDKDMINILFYSTFWEKWSTSWPRLNGTVLEGNKTAFQPKWQNSVRMSTWSQPRWDLLSDSGRRSKSSSRCLLDDRLWWHQSTGHTGDACRLCNVCREESQICDTDRGESEWKDEDKEKKENIHLLFTFLLCMNRNVCFVSPLGRTALAFSLLPQ